jgi:transcriptional regulator with XRE-family HTH domain
MIKTIISTTDKHVGDRVRMRRAALGVSQSTLGAKVGVTFQQIQKYENGTNRISASRLSQIADVLQVKEAYFFESALRNKPLDTVNSANQILNFLASPEGEILVKAFTQIKDAKLRRHIVDLVERIAETRGN